jgi:hypothetical protein
MRLRTGITALAVVLIACMTEAPKPLTLQIILPPYYTDRVDTIHTDTIPVEGETTAGATISIGATDNPTTPVTVDNVGHFAGQIVVENLLESQYSVFVMAKMDTRSILESRSVYYKPLP